MWWQYACPPLVHKEELCNPWWVAAREGDATALQRLHNEQPSRLCATSRATVATATVMTSWDCQVSATAALICADAGHTEALAMLLSLGADSTLAHGIELREGSGYEADEDDFATWLAPITLFDRYLDGHPPSQLILRLLSLSLSLCLQGTGERA